MLGLSLEAAVQALQQHVGWPWFGIGTCVECRLHVEQHSPHSTPRMLALSGNVC